MMEKNEDIYNKATTLKIYSISDDATQRKVNVGRRIRECRTEGRSYNSNKEKNASLTKKWQMYRPEG